MRGVIKGLAVLLAVAFVVAGSAKVAGARQMRAELTRLGVGARGQVAIGALELIAAAAVSASAFGGAWLRGLGVAAAVGLALLMAGAVAAHLRHGDTPKAFGPPALLGVLAATLGVLTLA